MRNWHVIALSVALVSSTALSGCSSRQATEEHYVSPKVEGEAQKINLDEVQKAFWDSKGKDFNEWMAAFEKRVNEIYDGKEVVSIDATRKEGKLVVTGYIDKLNKEGFQEGDEKLFTVEQTGEAVNKDMPYRVGTGEGRTYYEGHHSLLDSPIVQYMLLSHMMGGWGGRYYTPPHQVVVLGQHRDTFRTSPSYSQQKTANQGFFSRFKTNSSGGLQSSTKFGGSGLSSGGGSQRRSLFGGSPSSSTTGGTTSLWGGRRSSGSGMGSFGGGGFGRSRGWGGFRRR